MSYVNPSGIIELFKGINLDNRYMHTLYFADSTARDNYFNGYVDQSIRFDRQSYTRVNSNVVRLKVNAENVQDVTYMRFTNRGNRYYYCFVNAINYVNENTTEIFYEIDVMQTWYFGHTAQEGSCLQNSYVKRMHVSSDRFREHLEPEPVGSDSYRMDALNVDGGGSFDEYSVVIGSTAEPDDADMVHSGVLTGSKYMAFLITSGNLIKQWIYDQLGSWDKNEQSAEITDMYMFPTEYCTLGLSGGSNSKTLTVHGVAPEGTYNPINKKMYTYPYSFLYATTMGGDSAEYRWEYFDSEIMPNGSIDFYAESNECSGGSIICYPSIYNGVVKPYDCKLSINNFPKCSYSIDAYQAFVASGGQTKLNTQADILNQKGMVAALESSADVVGLIKSSNKAAESFLTGDVTGAMNNTLAVGQAALNTTANIASRMINLEEGRNKIEFAFKDARYAPNIMVGAQDPAIAVGKKFLGFYFFNCHVDPPEAVRIDNFFSTYGYAINEVTTPLDHGRPYWNFLQTEGAVIKGKMPATSKEAIARILDGGIFFWNSANITNDNIGNFKMRTRNVNGGTQIINVSGI